jgi:hypothetical protein
MKKYRIKTKREFIRDFGSDWRNVVRSQFPVQMDHLLNYELSERENENMNAALDKGSTSFMSHYTISGSMVTEIFGISTSLSPTLFKKKRIKLKQGW